MPILRMPASLRSYTDGHSVIPVHGQTVSEALQDLVRIYPSLLPHLYDKKGMVRPFVNLFVDDKNVRTLQGLDTPLNEEDYLLLIPSIAGGSQY